MEEFMREETIVRLRKISMPKKFSKDDYICYEGQPGNEMYIILAGSVGVFITSAIGTLTQVATIDVGSFFGEMAIFDNLPRSASCIALEDTVVVAVTQNNLLQFLETCPEIAKQILESMSGRIRRLDDELYRNTRFVKNRQVPKFEIPAEYGFSHVVKEPYQDPKYFMEYRQSCPICGKAINVKDLKRNKLETKSMDLDSRISYFRCEPLWYEVVSCPYCQYSNHYLKFFGINNFEQEVIERVLEEEHRPVLEDKTVIKSDFDRVVAKYLQAIHINEHINPNANVLLGGLWRNLYWLIKDSMDMNFAEYCATRAMEKFKLAIEGNEFFDATSKSSTALSLASLYAYLGSTVPIPQYIEIAVDSPDERIKENALKVKERYEKMQKK